MKQHAHIFVRGRVQGVFFRDYTRRQAESMSLAGTVKNLSSGGVEIFVQGAPHDVEAFIQWCWEGSPMSDVTAVEVNLLPEDTSLSRFSILC